LPVGRVWFSPSLFNFLHHFSVNPKKGITEMRITEKIKPRFEKRSGKGYIRIPLVDDEGNSKRDSKGKIIRKCIYLEGDFDSKEMWEHFEKLKRRDACTETKFKSGLRFDESLNISVRELYYRFTDYETNFRDANSEVRSVKERDARYLSLLREVGGIIEPYLNLPCDQFRSGFLIEIMDELISVSNNARQTIKNKVRVVKRMFAFGAERNLCDVGIYNSLNEIRVPAHAKQRVKREAVLEDDIALMIESASPTLRTMLILHRYTGMRSGNLLDITWDQIDKSYYESHQCFVYTPSQHKTKKHLDKLSIVIGPIAVEALMNYENTRPDRGHEFIFNPAAATSYGRYDQAKRARKNIHTGINKSHKSYKIYQRLKKGNATTAELKSICPRYFSSIQRLRGCGCTIEVIDELSTTRSKVYTLTSYEKPRSKCKSWIEVYESIQSNLNPQYNKDSYRHATQRLAQKVGVKNFMPHKLRHRRNTEIVKLADKTSAQAVLGHLTEQMTDNYNHDQRLDLALSFQQTYG